MKLVEYLRSHLLWKMLFWFVLLLLLPCLLLMGAYFAVNNYYFAQETAELERSALIQCANSIEQDLETCAEVFQVIQRHSSFVRFLNGGYATPALQLAAYHSEFFNMFSYAKSFSPYIENVQIYTLRDGLISIDDDVLPISQLEEYALDRHTTYGFWRYQPEEDRFIYRRLLSSLYDSTPAGVLEVICRPTLAGHKLLRFSESVSRPVYAVYKGKAYQAKDESLVPAPLPAASQESLCLELTALSIELRADQRVLQQEDQHPVNLLTVTALAGVGAVIASSCLFFFYIFRLSRRIVRFSRYISISFTQIPGAYTDPGRDELSLVVKNFNQMLEQNSDLINQIKLEKLLQNEMAYRVLQAQIDPHFIYNALESVRMMAELHDEPEIADVIFSFSKLMRYSFSANTGPATLEYELDIVRQYLRVQKLRLDDRLRYDIFCPQELLGLSCPQFVLQPLVENAIKYGRDQARPALSITVRLSSENGLLTAAVENDGAPLDPEKQEKINQRLKEGLDLSGLSSGTGVGLDSINTRMRYLYPESFFMELLPGLNNGVRVVMTWRPQKEEGGHSENSGS